MLGESTGARAPAPTPEATARPIAPTRAPNGAFWLRIGLVAGIGFATLRLLATAAWSLAEPFAPTPTLPPDPAGAVAFSASFIVCFAPLLYAFLCLLAGRWLRPAPGELLAAAGVTFLCASTAEIVVDSAFVALTGQPAWRYLIWPVHQGYTSGVGLVMWPLYGAFVHMLHGVLRSDPRFLRFAGNGARGVLIAADAMLLEVFANLFSLIGFGSFYFYYLPDDLLHFTTAQIFLPYCAAGLGGVWLLNRIEGRAWAPALGAAAWAGAAALVLGVW